MADWYDDLYSLELNEAFVVNEYGELCHFVKNGSYLDVVRDINAAGWSDLAKLYMDMLYEWGFDISIDIYEASEDALDMFKVSDDFDYKMN